jgi:uncharacterized protein (UPF0332 family)
MMNFDRRAFLSSARQLATPAPEGTPLDLGAVNLRSAVSRSYYAAFWRARALLQQEGERLPRLDTNQFVISAFRDSPLRRHKAVGAHLIQLRAERNNADYQSNIGTLPELRTWADRAIQLAAIVVAQIDQLER